MNLPPEHDDFGIYAEPQPTDPGRITRFDWFLLFGGMLIGAALMGSAVAWFGGGCG